MKIKLDNMKDLDVTTIALEIPNLEGIPFRYMTPEEEARIDEITKNSFYKPKYRHALKVITQLDVQEYFKACPDAHAKDVLGDIMKTYNPDIPSDILLDVAQIILAEWESLKTSEKGLALA